MKFHGLSRLRRLSLFCAREAISVMEEALRDGDLESAERLASSAAIAMAAFGYAIAAERTGKLDQAVQAVGLAKQFSKRIPKILARTDNPGGSLIKISG